MTKPNTKLHIELMLDDEPILTKEFLFDLKNNDLVFKSENNQKRPQGGFLPALLGSLLPIGIDLFSKLLDRGHGITGNGIYGNGIPKKIDLKKNKHTVTVLDKKTKKILKQFKTNSLGGALLSDAGFFKDVLKLENELKGDGLYARGLSAGNGLYASGLSAGNGGQIGSNKYINN